MPADTTLIDVAGQLLKISNLNKLFYPAAGFTKGAVLDYYIRIAPALLPHLAGRPLTMKRYPNGAASQFFYQKRCPAHRPPWLKTAALWSGRNETYVDYCVIGDLPSLVWAVNLAALELHVSLSSAADTNCPSTLVFDLDPGPPATILTCCQVALLLKKLLDDRQLTSFAKTSGSKGLQIYVPLNTPTGYNHTKDFARMVAQHLEREHPHLVVAKMAKKLRAGKVFIDWSQNDEHKTTVCVYSLRARDIPSVSTPVTWDEVVRAWEDQGEASLTFDASRVMARFEQSGDLFAPVLQLQQTLPLIKKLTP